MGAANRSYYRPVKQRKEWQDLLWGGLAPKCLEHHIRASRDSSVGRRGSTSMGSRYSLEIGKESFGQFFPKNLVEFSNRIDTAPLPEYRRNSVDHLFSHFPI